MSCGRCKIDVPSGREETCWYCLAALCSPCWELLGHCGHEEAESLNRLSRELTPEQRRQLAEQHEKRRTTS